MFADAAKQYTLATGRAATWPAVDRYYRDQVVAFWRAEPWRALKLAARKTVHVLHGSELRRHISAAVEIQSGFNPWLRLAPLPVPWVLSVACVGLVMFLRRPIYHAPEWLLLAVPLVVTVIFWYTARYAF